MEHFRTRADEISISQLLDEILETTGYIEELKTEGEIEAEARIENIDELKNKIAAYEEACQEQGERPGLSGFLEEVALVADVDSLDENSDYVVLMTLHSAKGLEFPQVYLAGMEDGLFPSYMTITGGDSSELEEERRLCYVGITRARKSLTMTAAMMRMVRGETQYNKTSRFIREIPRELVDLGRDSETARSYSRPAPFGAAERSSRPAAAFTFQPRQFTVKKPESPGL